MLGYFLNFFYKAWVEGRKGQRAESSESFSASDAPVAIEQVRWTNGIVAVYFYYDFQTALERRVPYPVGGFMKTFVWVFNGRGSSACFLFLDRYWNPAACL
jgi:hypothetical protein